MHTHTRMYIFILIYIHWTFLCILYTCVYQLSSHYQFAGLLGNFSQRPWWLCCSRRFGWSVKAQEVGRRPSLQGISFQYLQYLSMFSSVLPFDTRFVFWNSAFWVTQLSIFQLRKVPLVRLGRDPQVKEASGVNICNMVIHRWKLTKLWVDHNPTHLCFQVVLQWF